MLTPPMAQRIELWPLEKLISYARNPRTHSDAQVEQIAASISESVFDGILTLAVVDFGGCDGQSYLLADGPREKAAHTMCPPPGRLHQFGQGCFR